MANIIPQKKGNPVHPSSWWELRECDTSEAMIDSEQDYKGGKVTFLQKKKTKKTLFAPDTTDGLSKKNWWRVRWNRGYFVHMWIQVKFWLALCWSKQGVTNSFSFMVHKQPFFKWSQAFTFSRPCLKENMYNFSSRSNSFTSSASMCLLLLQRNATPINQRNTSARILDSTPYFWERPQGMSLTCITISWWKTE